MLGLAYKKNIGDTRESPALRLMDLMRARGASVDYYDPFLAEIPCTREHAALAGQKGIEWNLEQIGSYDTVLIATDHDDVDYCGLASSARLIIDTRNACSKAGADLRNVVPA